ncbi:hypothetical protein GCM10010345_43310 [Streptomyces canarius]|uniref:Transposase n=1 Tax=Streptomyces canarius TaxID=285453 RepID=A0ABQ3CR86_9ACTN|nr:hypothetical protein GCM10010300_51560 [Streptomyces olivaceoviridis]GHA34085.1 hypothetical protein GCM10010345_43310 [Streptomyces canarius]
MNVDERRAGKIVTDHGLVKPEHDGTTAARPLRQTVGGQGHDTVAGRDGGV